MAFMNSNNRSSTSNLNIGQPLYADQLVGQKFVRSKVIDKLYWYGNVDGIIPENGIIKQFSPNSSDKEDEEEESSLGSEGYESE